MRIQLCEHFDYKKLLRFVFPSVAMMVFGSIYGIVVICLGVNYFPPNRSLKNIAIGKVSAVWN